MMYCTVQSWPGLTRGNITARGDADRYYFDLDYMHARWVYRGKVSGASFISVDVTGDDMIPQEFYDALWEALSDPNGFHEFPDPFFDSLEVAGT